MRISDPRHPLVSTAIVAVLTLMGMIVFQAAKRLIHPDITLNQSNTISVCAATMLAALLTYVVLRHRARLERELRREIEERMRVEKQLHQVSETEKRKLGHDLHDGLGQHLAGIEYSAKALETQLAAKGLPERKLAARLADLTNQAVVQTRDLSRLLMPVESDAGGLQSALAKLAVYMSDGVGVDCCFEGPDLVAVNDPFAATQLFRIAQESVTNAVKHGRASQIVIDLRATNDILQLTIRDNGIGLPADHKREKGLGLRLMQRRAHSIGATLEIQGRKEEGTRVMCEWRNAT